MGAMAQQGSSSTPQTPPATPSQPEAGSQTGDQKAADQKTGRTETAGAVAQMKTKTYKGVLMDASCAGVKGSAMTATTAGNTGSAETPGTPSNPATPATPGSETKPASNQASKTNKEDSSANRSADSAAAGSCGVSSGSAAYAFKLDDGRLLALDMVGNERVKDQIQKNKKWTQAASSNQPIHAKVSGVESGDKLVVSAVH
jgi:hypothetical protein